MKNGKRQFRARRTFQDLDRNSPDYGCSYKYEAFGMNDRQAETKVKRKHVEAMAKIATARNEKVKYKQRYHSMTLNDINCEWLQSRIDRSISPLTYSNYSRMWKNKILPGLGSVKINELDNDHIASFYKQLENKNITEKEIIKTNQSLHQCLNWLVQKKILPENPLDNEAIDNVTRRLNKKQANVKSKRTAVEVFGENHFDICKADELREYIYGKDFELLILLALEAGFRPQETCAVRYQDFVNDDVYVQQAIKRVNKNQIKGTDLENQYPTRTYVGTPKSNAGFRPLPYSRFSSRIKEIRDSWEMKKDKNGILMPVKKGLYFPTKFGGAQSPENFQRIYFKPIVDELELGQLTSLGMLRKYFATYQAKEVNCSRGVLQDYMGHTSYTTTDKYYQRKIHFSCDKELEAKYREPKLALVGENYQYKSVNA